MVVVTEFFPGMVEYCGLLYNCVAGRLIVCFAAVVVVLVHDGSLLLAALCHGRYDLAALGAKNVRRACQAMARMAGLM